MFLCEKRNFVIAEGMIHSVESASEQHPKCSIYVRLESTDLKYSSQWDRDFERVKSANGVFLNLN